jgi:hypothetical protein
MSFRNLSYCLACIFFLGLTGCNSTPEQVAEATEKTVEEVTETAVEAVKPEMDGTYGIRVGDVIADNEKLRKDVLQTGEGDFDIYYFDADDGQPAGYVMEDLQNPILVGDVYVIRKGATVPGAKGVKVGDSWGDLRAAFPEVEVHGSEIQSWTYAYVGEMSFKLEASNTEYELSHSDVSDSAKIQEIAYGGK